MEDFTNSSTDYSTACACTQSHFDREKNEFSEVLPLKKPAALQPSLPIVHCDAIYTVRAQNCPLKSNGQPVTKFMLFCCSAVLCRCTCMHVDTIFFRISKLHVYVQVPMYLPFLYLHICTYKYVQTKMRKPTIYLSWAIFYTSPSTTYLLTYLGSNYLAVVTK